MQSSQIQKSSDMREKINSKQTIFFTLRKCLLREQLCGKYVKTELSLPYFHNPLNIQCVAGGDILVPCIHPLSHLVLYHAHILYSAHIGIKRA